MGDEDILVDFLFDLVRLANVCYHAAEAKRDVIDMTAEDKVNHAKARKVATAAGHSARAFGRSGAAIASQAGAERRAATTAMGLCRCRGRASLWSCATVAVTIATS